MCKIFQDVAQGHFVNVSRFMILLWHAVQVVRSYTSLIPSVGACAQTTRRSVRSNVDHQVLHTLASESVSARAHAVIKAKRGTYQTLRKFI